MTAPNRVLLMQLSQRTSARGNTYLSGWLGKASVVGFAGEPDKFGNATWDLFVSEPQPRGESRGEKPDGKGFAGRPDQACGHKLDAPCEGLAGGARDRGGGANAAHGQPQSYDRSEMPHGASVPYDRTDGSHAKSPARAPGWRGSAYRRPRAPAPAGLLEPLDDSLEGIGR